MPRPKKPKFFYPIDADPMNVTKMNKRTPEQREGIKNFLRDYRQQECLWNSNRRDYTSQAARMEAFQEMAQRSGKTVEEVKKKIHAIRSTYNQMRVKVMEAEATGRLYKPILSWYDDASFLDSVIRLRKNRESIPFEAGEYATPTKLEIKVGGQASSAELDEFLTQQPSRKRRMANAKAIPIRLIREKDEQEEYLVDTDETNEEYQVEYETKDDEEYVEGDGSGYEIVHMESHPNASGSSNAQFAVEAEQVIQRPTARNSAAAAAAGAEPKDEIALFGDFMVGQLRAISHTMAIEMMCKIQSMVTEARLEELRRIAIEKENEQLRDSLPMDGEED